LLRHGLPYQSIPSPWCSALEDWLSLSTDQIAALGDAGLGQRRASTKPQHWARAVAGAPGGRGGRSAAREPQWPPGKDGPSPPVAPARRGNSATWC